MDDPCSYPSHPASSHAHAPAPAPAAAASSSGMRAAASGGMRQAQDEAAVQDVKWLWEPDDGADRWVPYDALLSQKIERQFQLWVMATSTTCAVCTSRRHANPPDFDSTRGSFSHSLRPGVNWKFSFTVSRSGQLMFTQVCTLIFFLLHSRHAPLP